MNCKLIHLIFDRKNFFHFSFNRDAQVEAILELGRVKRISIDFLSDICHHPNHPSQIFWHEIPIVCIRCIGAQCDFEVLNNIQNILFQLIQPVIQLPIVRYIAILVNLVLPGWNTHQEFIMALNRAGKLLLIPTEIALAPLELLKLKKNWRIRVNKLIELKNNLKLLDAIKPRLFPNSEFRIFIQ
ncbi:MAG: hypothetical protein JSU57_01820 [Candidatus Heimdallarchaeota archaeon]|nr:MAG: hypothetical protein JSU57_01820 [Candidatus Heimdallarchaeota archaeon]